MFELLNCKSYSTLCDLPSIISSTWLDFRTNHGWRAPFLRKYLPSPSPGRKKTSRTDERHRKTAKRTCPPCIILSVHVKQAVGIELRVLGYLNPKVIVDDAIPVHINPSRGKLVGI